MKLYIFRHGETHETKNNIPYDKTRVEIAEILPESIEPLKKLATYLKDIKTDANYVSPYLRCIQTAEIVSDMSNKSFQVNELISECRLDIEPFEKFSVRVENFLKRLEDQQIQSAAVCTHGGIIAGLKHFMLEGKFQLEHLGDFPKPGILIKVDSDSATEKNFNT